MKDNFCLGMLLKKHILFLKCCCRLCCASVSSNNEYLCGGFEDSSVRVWRLLPGLFPAVCDKSGPSEIFLSTDYIDNSSETEEDEMKASSRSVRSKR